MIKNHQTSSTSNIIKHHQTSSNIIKHHQTSSNIINISVFLSNNMKRSKIINKSLKKISKSSRNHENNHDKIWGFEVWKCHHRLGSGARKGVGFWGRRVGGLWKPWQKHHENWGILCQSLGYFWKMGGFSSFLSNIRLDHRNLKQNI